MNTRNIIFATTSLMIALLMVGMEGCKKESTAPRQTTYQLKTKDQLGVTGTVTFTETSNSITTIDIVLNGGDSLNHPAHIHLNSAVEGGAIAVSLNPVIGGKSTTQVTALDNNTLINYSQLIVFGGYVNVHESSSNLGLLLAQGDIGGNALTGTNKSYILNTDGTSGVSGTVLFEKRVNGKTLTSITLTGTIAGGVHPAAIYIGSVATLGGGPVVKTLNAVDGTTGKSFSNITELDNGTAINYDDILVYDGYLAVTQSAVLSANILCQGNIGTH
jgi:hypothetical protein